MICCGSGKYKISLLCHNVGKDRFIVISGGEEEHIGSASLVCDEKFSSKNRAKSLVRDGHMDHHISEKMAELIYEKLNEVILVICGIHIDNACKKDIDILIKNAEICVNQFIELN